MKFQIAQKRANLGSDITTDHSVCQADFRNRTFDKPALLQLWPVVPSKTALGGVSQ
jgi:hypothetical protein